MWPLGRWMRPQRHVPAPSLQDVLVMAPISFLLMAGHGRRFHGIA